MLGVVSASVQGSETGNEKGWRDVVGLATETGLDWPTDFGRLSWAVRI